MPIPLLRPAAAERVQDPPVLRDLDQIDIYEV
jgi:hypothetical protein